MPPVDNPAEVAAKYPAANESALRGLFLGTTGDYCPSLNIYQQAAIKNSKAKEHKGGKK